MTVGRLRAELELGEFGELVFWQMYYGRKAQRAELAQAKAKG